MGYRAFCLRTAVCAGLFAGAAEAAASPSETSRVTAAGIVVTPASSIAQPQDAGLRAHTNVKILFPDGVRAARSGPNTKFETPGSLACLYGFVPRVKGCSPANAKTVPTGGSKIVAIVDAYDYPMARHDLQVFSRKYGLPDITDANFKVVYAAGTQPVQDPCGGCWELEEALDIEMAHAMAPGAKIVLVEAASANNPDLLAAELVAGKLVTAAGGGTISNSWGEAEYPGEAADESNFESPNAVYLASTGDSPGTEVPSIFPNVIAVGGTTIERAPDGSFQEEIAWIDGGGGSSLLPVPSYQSQNKGVARRVRKLRGAPDIAFDADPDSGVWIYDSYPYGAGYVYGWLVIGGTSVASPAMAGVLNTAGSFAPSTESELATIYAGYPNAANWTDIFVGLCGNNDASLAWHGYDFCTGLGVPRGYAGK